GRARGARPPLFLSLAGALLAAAALLPAAYLLVVTTDAGSEALETIWRAQTAELVLRSLGLTLAVTAAAIAISLPLAWLTARTDLPGRRLWTVVAALPLAIPSYIGAYALLSALGPSGLLQDLLEPLGVERLPSIAGFAGAWLTLTLFTYPFVLLPVRAALRRLDPQLEEAALGMGRSRADVYRTVVLPHLVPAIGAGALLVSLYVLSDFGAVSIMRFDSFTTSIYTLYRASFDRVGAASLATLLTALMLVVLWLESRMRRSEALYRSAPGTAREIRLVPLGRWRWPALAFCSGNAGHALVLPTAVLGYWSLQSVAGEVDWGEVLAAAGHSLLAAGLAALISGLCAIPIAVLAVRFRSPFSSLVERSSYTGHALPGIVVALALVFFGTRVVPDLYQTLAMLVFAFVVLFLPLAVGVARASLLQVSPRVEEAARSLGRSPFAVLRTITVPLISPGLLAGVALVFLTAVKELPATLILAPIGFETLATEIWKATSVGFFERGAVPSLILLAISAAPLYLLTERD
ncbi:MAG: iron(III) transport system permease protein, partial [Solirubrobacterales bacterium]|nr:iron(III) transport system permease protein [Solirubrobacterales bacterium]